MKTYLAVYFGTVLMAMILVPIVSRVAKLYRLLDAPGPRKVHKTPIPRIGGIVFLISTLVFVLPVFLLNNNIGQSFRELRIEFAGLLIGAVFIFVVGLIDDLRPIKGYIKLFCLIIASLVICASGKTLHSISIGKWFVVNTGLAAWPLTVLWIIIITVCIGVIDGLDGLAAGIAAIVCGTLTIMAFWSGQTAMSILMLALLGSITGFLFFNFYPAKIFMGDCGSMFLGFMIGASSIIFQTKTHTLLGLAIPFLVMGVPIIDTGFVVIARRYLDRRSIFAPDRKHLHHRLLDLGLHHRTVVIVIYAVTIISACIGVLLLTIGGGWSLGLLMIGLLLLFSMFACLHGRRFCDLIMTMKHNLVIKHSSLRDRYTFEMAQVRMRESRSFQEWWETLCDMGEKMDFQSISLWNCSSGQHIRTCVCSASDDKFRTGKSTAFVLPISNNGSEKLEIRVQTSVNGFLELSGRQAMLLGRLMDEFPIPKNKDKAEQLELFDNEK